MSANRVTAVSGRHTSRPSAADGAVAGVLSVAADVPDFCVDHGVAREVVAVQVLDAPEATRCDSRPLSTFGDVLWRGALGREAHGAL